MKKALLTLAMMAMTLNMVAAPADPTPCVFTQSDGSQLTVYLVGDEHFNYYSTSDDVVLSRKGNAFYVADIHADGSIHSTGILAHERHERSAYEEKLVQKQDVQQFRKQGAERVEMARVLREPVSGSLLFPHTGSPKAIVILVEFSDEKFTIEDPARSFDQYLNSLTQPVDYGYGETDNISSVRHYFQTMSYGTYDPQFDIYGPVSLSKSYKDYGGTNDTGTDEDMTGLLKDACTAADDLIDFSQYDANGDGNIDLVYVIYAGYSQSFAGNPVECIWPKSGTVTLDRSFDGKSVRRYGVNNELNGYPNCYSTAPFKRINGIGLFCHEFSHCLGLPDLYPVPTSLKEDNQSMEYWSLMDLGTYLRNGNVPTPYTAWERESMGWLEVETMTESPSELDMVSLELGGKAYRILNTDDETGREYYMIENIQRVKFAQGHRGHGLVVTHVNYDPSAFSLNNNCVNSTIGQPRMTVVPADGLLLSNKWVGKSHLGQTWTNPMYYAQIAGDPFPGTSNVTSLTPESTLPNLALWKTKEHEGDSYTSALDILCDIISKMEESDGHIIITTTGIDGIKEDKSTVRKGIYTLDGRRMSDSATLPHGIYIIDGKKTVK